eukprot:1212966-Pyramimonas_sp.AAC.1
MSEDSRAAETEQQRSAEAAASATADEQRPAPMSPPTVTSWPPSLSEYDFDLTMRRPEDVPFHQMKRWGQTRLLVVKMGQTRRWNGEQRHLTTMSSV